MEGRCRPPCGMHDLLALAGIGTGHVRIVAKRCGAPAQGVFDRTSDEPIELELPTPPAAPPASPFPPTPAAPWFAPPAKAE